jgi:hypothetical protein
MRVGISGTHGTGKTTLAGALCAHLPGHVMADEPYYLLEEEGHEFGFPPSLEDYRALLARSLRSLSSPPLLPGVVLTGRVRHCGRGGLRRPREAGHDRREPRAVRRKKLLNFAFCPESYDRSHDRASDALGGVRGRQRW